MTSGRTRYRSYSGLLYLFLVILISIWGNVLYQVSLFPIFPYPLFVSFVSYVFPVLSVFTAISKKYDRQIWMKYIRVAPFMLLNSLMAGIMYNWSLLLTSMSAVTVITSSSTLFSLLFSRILLKTPIQLSTVISIHLSIVGSVLVVLSSTEPSPSAIFFSRDVPSITSDSDDETSTHTIGCILALLSSVCSGLSSVLYQKLEVKESDAYLTVSGATASLYFMVYLILNQIFQIESLTILQSSTAWDVIQLFALNGVISSVIGTQLYIQALNRLSPVTVNVLFSVSIPLSVIVDYYRGAIHAVTPTFLFGALLVLLSTVLVPIEQEQTDLADTQLQSEIPLLVIPCDDVSPRAESSTSSQARLTS